MKSLKLLQAMLHDVGRQYPEHKHSLDRDFVTIERRFKHEGFSFLAKTLPILGDAVFTGLEDGRFTCPMNFRSKGALPLLLGGLLKHVFDERTGSVLEHGGEAAYLLEVRQICYLFKKSLANQRDERTLDDKAKDTFVQCDLEVLDENQDSTLERISQVLFHPTTFSEVRRAKPRNGPGGVAEGYRSNQRYKMVLGSLPDYFLSLFGLSFCEESQCETDDTSARASHVAIIHSVPKTSTSRRTITIEPACNMFMQQAWNDVLRAKISNDPNLRGSITLDDQKPSQELALSSSDTRFYATVDLSAASDRLPLSLVETCFKHDSILLDGLKSCRTSYAQTDKIGIKLRKYAGMGNATTFPVQSLVFAFLSVKAILIAWDKQPTTENCRRALALVRVFGDDIILPTYAYSALIGQIEAHGLKVNRKKSFCYSSFRESCGCDAYKGVDITPSYARFDLTNLRNPNELASCVSLSNQLWERGYLLAATYLKDIVEEVHGSLPLVPKNSSGLGWHTRQNASTPEKWNKNLHRFDVRTLCLGVKRRIDNVTGLPALLKFFCESADPHRDLERSVVRYSPSIKRRWIASC